MKRLTIVILNFILLIVGFAIIIRFPTNSLTIAFGMFFIAISIISFAVLIYFPPPPQLVKLKVIEESPKTISRASLKPKKRKKTIKKAKRKRRR